VIAAERITGRAIATLDPHRGEAGWGVGGHDSIFGFYVCAILANESSSM